MASKFELCRSPDDKFVFHLTAGDGQRVLTSESHASRASALMGIELVKKHGADDRRYGRLCSRDGAPFFTLKACNGQVIAKSPLYRGAKARDAGIEAAKLAAGEAVMDDSP